MNSLLYILRFIDRIFWWLLLGTFIVTLLVILGTRNLPHIYDSDMTVFTGVVSESETGTEQIEKGTQDWNILNNTLQNIMNIITSKETLRNVSMHLYARCMINGNPNEDNIYITAEHYRQLVDITPKDVRKLIDKTSESKTVANLEAYVRPNRYNFVYGLFNWFHPHFSYNALKNIEVKRVEGSDILEISYSNNDPGIVYQTLDILNDVYIKEYKTLQYGTTNNVIKYFEAELARVGKELRSREDSLTEYNIANRVINYDKQTEQVTALDRDYELRYQDVHSAYSSSKAALEDLEQGMAENMKTVKNNSEFLSRLNRISDLNYSIAEMQTSGIDTLAGAYSSSKAYLGQLHHQLSNEERSLKSFMDKYSSQKYTRDGYPTSNFVSQWVDELIKLKKAEAELNVVQSFKEELDKQYAHFSPIGSTVKRQERSINFTENTYLSILSSLNAARLRLKSLEMNSASLRLINPPTFPLDSRSTKRTTFVLAAAAGSFFFILGIFLIIELLDRTLRDKYRTEKITTGKVVGAFPRTVDIKKKKGAEISGIATHYLANQLFSYIKTTEKPQIINLFSISESVNTADVLNNLSDYWEKIGIKVQCVKSTNDFQPSTRDFLYSHKISDLVHLNQNSDLVMVSHSPLEKHRIPASLLQEATLNLLILRADSVWKESDQLILNDLINQAAQSPVLICLSESEKSSVENFTGLLPPYTGLRRFIYRFFYQMGFTSSANA